MGEIIKVDGGARDGRRKEVAQNGREGIRVRGRISRLGI